ncbi:MAG: MFS transporter [Eubacteriales bacterium]
MTHILLALIYLAFISLGLPDAVLGSAWPTISQEFNAPLASMGIISIIISAGTILSSLQSDRMTQKLGTGTVTILSIFLTAIALLGFARSNSVLSMCLWAIPYGLGAGSVDAALNNYVAIHYESKHMSWLHCMWGLGATMGPYVMGMALTSGWGFRTAYYVIFGLQILLTTVLLINKSAWSSKSKEDEGGEENRKVLTIKEIVRIKGVPQIMFAFFCFCSIELTTGMWASSYFVLVHGVNLELAATYTSLFYLGITIGRAISGFITMKYNDTQMIRGGELIMCIGMSMVLLSSNTTWAFAGLLIIGLGSAPVYPCIIHSTPANFGVSNSQAITGVQMASAYTGSLLMPSLFGLIAEYISIHLYAIYLLGLLLVMALMYEWLLRKVKKE